MFYMFLQQFLRLSKSEKIQLRKRFHIQRVWSGGVWYDVVWKGDIVYYSTVYGRYVVYLFIRPYNISLPPSPALSVFCEDSRQILLSVRKTNTRMKQYKSLKRGSQEQCLPQSGLQQGEMFTIQCSVNRDYRGQSFLQYSVNVNNMGTVYCLLSCSVVYYAVICTMQCCMLCSNMYVLCTAQ